MALGSFLILFSQLTLLSHKHFNLSVNLGMSTCHASCLQTHPQPQNFLYSDSASEWATLLPRQQNQDSFTLDLVIVIAYGGVHGDIYLLHLYIKEWLEK
jgi:hypothetical protein